MRTVLYVFVILGAALWLTFTVTYACTRVFWRSAYGWNLLGMGASLAALLGAFAWSYWVGDIPALVWTLLAGAIALVGAHRLALLVSTPRNP